MRVGRLSSRVAVGLALLLGASAIPAESQSAEELIQSQHVRISQRLEPPEPVYVGQPVRLWIEVMTRTWFLEAPKYPDTIEVSNAIVIPPDAFGVNSSKRIGSDTYAVQARSYTIFPQRTGRFEVPPISVVLVVARNDASKSPPITLRTDTITIEARLPAGAEGHGLVLSTPGITVSEEYSRSTAGLKVGDSFERRVTMTIEDSVAMMLPPMSFDAGPGVAIYPGRPEVNDQRNRGDLRGTRVDQATFVMEAEGTYRLPAVTISWWNLRTSQLVEEVLPEVEFTVEPNPDLAAEHLGEPEVGEEEAAEVTPIADERDWNWWQMGLVGAGLLVAIYLLRGPLRRWFGDRQPDERQEESEAEVFQRFQKTAQTGDPAATYGAFLNWLDRASPGARTLTARQFLEASGDDELTRQFETLDQSLFGAEPATGETAWSGGAFAESVGRARKRWLDGGSGDGEASESLPPLNPVDTVT